MGFKIANRPGKSVVLSSDYFGGNTPQAILAYHLEDKRIRSRRLPDGIYLWLEDKPEVQHDV